MANIIEELIIALGFKVDTKPLQDAEKAGKESLKHIGDESDKQAKRAAFDWSKMGDALKKGFADASKAANKEATKIGDVWNVSSKDVTAAFSKMKVAALAVSAAVAGTLGSTILTAKSFGEEGDRIAKTAGQIGIGVEELQRLEFASGRSGASVELLHQSLKKVALGMEEATTKGTGPFKEGLDGVGVQVGQLAGLSGEDRLGFLADKLNGIQDPAKRTALAMKLFGETGADLQPLLARGAVGIKKLGDEAQSLGLVLSESATKEAEDLTDKLSDTEKVIKAASLAIGKELAPVVKEMAEGTIEWVRQNEDFIKQDIPALMTSAAHAAAGLTRAVVEIGKAMAQVVNQSGELSRGLKEVFGLQETKTNQDFGKDPALDALRTDEERYQLYRQRERLRERAASSARIQEQTQQYIQVSNEQAAAVIAQKRADATAKAAARGKKSGGGGKVPRKFVASARELFGTEISKLAEQGGVGDIAVNASLEAAAKSLQEGANKDVALKAAKSRLGSLTGKDYSAKGSSDPLLSEIFGDNVPDVELSSLARGTTPSTLISNITNNFSFDNDFEIHDASDPMAVGESVAASIRNTFQDAIEQSTRLAKVKFER